MEGRAATTLDEVQSHSQAWLARPEAMIMAVDVDASLYAELLYGQPRGEELQARPECRPHVQRFTLRISEY